MWIQRINENTERLALPNLSKPVEFSDNGKAQVPKDDGELLIEKGYAQKADSSTDNETDDQGDDD